MEHGLARLRSNNPQMIMPRASPPHRLGAHDRVAPFMSQRAQPSETAKERMAQRVVGLIVTMGQMVRRVLRRYLTVGRRAVTALSINQYPMVRFNRRTTRPPRYFAMSTAGITDFFGDLLSPSYAVIFAIDHELISIGRGFGSTGS